MENIIKVLIYGNRSKVLGASCCKTSKKGGCSGCSGGCGGGSCGEDENNNLGDIFTNLEKFIFQSDIKDKVQLEFLELEENKLSGYVDIEELIERGFEAPIIVIDGIVRYYGGISNTMIYEDVKELLQ